MLTELCQELKNWFDRARYFGLFVIENGQILSRNDGDMGLKQGQYFRIIGSLFNEGVHQYPPSDLVDESFDGAVWALAIPKEVVDLSNNIDAWNQKYGGIDSVAMSPYNSESFGGYSYSKSGGGSSDGSSKAGTWRGAFASELNRWRKI
jgi:hypothetical protein